MKHISDAVEPQKLKEYRDSEPAATWNDFKNDAQDAYKHLVEYIVAHQNGLCAYCEIDLTETDRMIEHFHPKSDSATSHNWGLDFQNLLATCKGGTNPHAEDTSRSLEPLSANLSCDQPKGRKNLDEIILHPRDIPLSPSVFTVGMTGEINPDSTHCEQTGVPIQKIKATIDELNLNCNRLKDARRKVWDQLLESERRGETTDDLMSDFLLPGTNRRLFGFFTTIRSYFAPEADNFLARNAP
jgi:uncharacterized protein (TIGR02646 family)